MLCSILRLPAAGNMQPTSVDNISRSSSAALPTSQHHGAHEATADDITIAQGLLRLHSLPANTIPRRRSSFAGTSPSRSSLNGMDVQSYLLEVPRSAAGKVRSHQAIRTSNTWTSSDGEHVAEQDALEDRLLFVQEYNLLAKKHGVRDLSIDGSKGLEEDGDLSAKRESWFSRKILRKTSSTQSVRLKPDRSLRHRRSISDSLRLRPKKDKLKDKDLQELVLLCGMSRLYLPGEYAASSLSVPTCFRATAHYLVQHGTSTRGVFRIPGSHNVVASLYNHFCTLDEHGEVVAGTVHCPTLPDHIRCDVHDVASAFKKFLAGLPGGILGSLPLFDAFISIQTQLHGDAEMTRTKQSKVRARLIALAISTLRSQYRRELICAVFGLLCMIGRASETARREDDRGHPLPTSDLMGYGPLGIVFGPLLVGDMLEDYSMRLADPRGGLVLLPMSPPKSKKERKKNLVKSGDEGSPFNTHVDKIKVANSITEMLITHWRDVVRHLKNLQDLKTFASSQSLAIRSTKQPFLRPSASESFAIRKPPDWDDMRSLVRQTERSVSPTPMRRSGAVDEASEEHSLSVRKQRSKSRGKQLQRLSGTKSFSTLSPTKEEIPKDELHRAAAQVATKVAELSSVSSISYKENQPDSSIHKRPNQIDPNDSKMSINENQPPWQAALSLHPSTKPKPSDFIQQRVKNIEAQTSPSKEERKSSPKKLNKPHVHSPTKITWATTSTDNLRKSDIQRSAPLADSEKTNTIQRSSIPRKAVPNSTSSSEAPPTNFGSPQQANIAPVQKSRPDTRFSKANSWDEDGEYVRRLRGIAGSEPGFQTKTLVRPTRRISKSLYDDPRRKRNLVDVTRSTTADPLSRISHEEDLASLAELGKALDFDIPDENSDEIDKLLNEVTLDSEPCKRLDQVPSEKLPSKPQGFTKPQGTINSVLPRPVQSFSSNAPAAPMHHVPPRSSGSPSRRISTLVARFNHGDATADSKTVSTAVSPNKTTSTVAKGDLDIPKQKIVAPYTMNRSPTRSQVSGKSERSRGATRSPTPSPNRSNTDVGKRPILTAPPRSIRSPSPLPLRPNADLSRHPALTATPRSIHSPTPSPRRSNADITKNPSLTVTPRRNLRGSIHDSTPLRSVPKPTGRNASPSVNSSNPFAVSLRPVRKSFGQADGSPIKPILRQYRHEPAPTQVDGPSSTLTGSTCTFKSSSSGSQIAPVHDHPSRPARHRGFRNHQNSSEASEQCSIRDIPSVPSLDGKFSPSAFGGLTQSPEIEPGPPQHVHFKSSDPSPRVGHPHPPGLANFVHPESPLSDTFITSVPEVRAQSPRPSRRNSMLYVQLRKLQRDVAAKTEEIRQLKQQLAARQSVDVGALTDQLKEATRVIYFWKTRAETAEKQVRTAAKAPSRHASASSLRDLSPLFATLSSVSQGRRSPISPLASPIEERSKFFQDVEEDAKATDTARRSWAGLDGASSTAGWNSDATTDTVIREFRQVAITGSEYGQWVEQTMDALDYMTPED